MLRIEQFSLVQFAIIFKYNYSLFEDFLYLIFEITVIMNNNQTIIIIF